MALNISDKIIDAIEKMVGQAVASSQNNDVRTAIMGVPSANQYTVMIGGAEYVVPSGIGITFSVGDLVWVHLPNGSITDAYIAACVTPKTISSSVVTSGTSQKRQSATDEVINRGSGGTTNG